MLKFLPQQPKSQEAGVLETVVLPNRSKLIDVDGRSFVQLPDSFDRSWRQVGLALDRSGFTVEDRDRSKGIYQVRYVPVPDPKNEPGFFKKLFTSKKDAQPQQFQVLVQSAKDGAVVSVRGAGGAPDQTDSATGILKVLHQETR